MILYLCRHAAAQDATGTMKDENRPLSVEGMDKFRRVAKGFCALEPEVTHIVTSPLLRARQTGEILFDILAKHGHVSADPIRMEALGPPGKLDTFLARLGALEKAKNVIAVGHEPILSGWIGQICFSQRGGCVMKKGAIAAIDLTQRHRGELLWLMQPRHLRDLK